MPKFNIKGFLIRLAVKSFETAPPDSIVFIDREDIFVNDYVRSHKISNSHT